jgi:prevent-host-death family protein
VWSLGSRSGLDCRITGDTMLGMETVTIRDLRNHGGDVVDRVEAGERVTVTRDGRPVAELRPVRSRGVSSALLLERWRRLPAVEVDALRRDIDAIIDQSL